MRALVIAPQPFFSARGTPLSVYYRTLVMAELGVGSDLVTYGEGQDVEIPDLKIMRTPRFRWLGNVKIGPSWLKLFLDGWVVLRVIVQLVSRRYDFVHAHEEAIFFCRFLKPIFRFKLIYDMHSNLAQQLSNFRFTSSPIIERIFRSLQESCLRNSDAVITICPDLADYATAVLGESNRHVLIENSIFDPVRLVASPVALEHAGECEPAVAVPRNSRVVLYAGTLEPYQGIDLLIRSFRDVCRQQSEAFLLIVGGTDRQVASYTGLMRSLGIQQRAHFTGRVSHEEASKYLSMAAVVVSPRISGTNTPLKIYQQLASGIPLVATAIESHTQVLNNDVAYLASPSPDSFAEAIVSALTRRDESVARARRAQELYKTKYSRESYTAKVARVLELVA